MSNYKCTGREAGNEVRGSRKRKKFAIAKKTNAAWPLVNLHAAGIDVGSREHYVAVRGNSEEALVRTFGCYTPDLYEMADWLRIQGVTTIAMESTGVYWIPVFEVLESCGFEVLLIDPHGMKQIKTDVKDCRDIQRLHTYGLLRGAFRPAQQILVLRSYWRQRGQAVEQCAREIQLMQKALEQMNLQLHKAISDITGLTGMRIIRAIVAGEQNPVTLAQMRHQAIKAEEAELVKALTGNYRVEHLFALRQALEAFDFFQVQLKACEIAIHAQMSLLPAKTPRNDDANPKAAMKPTVTKRIDGKRKKEPSFLLNAEQQRLLGVDLSRIDGINTLTVQTIISEVGTDLTRFPSAKHFASWLGLCPNNRTTGGIIRSRRTRKVKHRLATAFRVAAQTLERSQSALGAYHRRLKSRIGAPKAVTATAHKLACLVYTMLTKGQDYVDKGIEYYEQQYHKRTVYALKRRAKAMGYELIPTSS